MTATPAARREGRWTHPGVRTVAAAVVVALLVGIGVLIARNRSGSGERRVPAGGVPSGEPVALPDAPLRARSSPVLAWTGRSLVVWGGYRGDPGGVPEALLDGAAFDDHGTWATITHNQWGHPGAIGTWAGDRLVVLAKNGGAEYRPDTMRWRDLPRLPEPGSGGFVAVGAANGSVYGLIASFSGLHDSVAIARLDPSATRWQLLATTTRGATASSFDLVGRDSGLDLWADGRRVAHYDIGRDTWGPGDGLTVPDGFGMPVVTQVGATVAVVDGGGAQAPAVFDPASARWLTLPGGAATVGPGTTATGAGDRLFLWGGEAHPRVWRWDIRIGAVAAKER